MLSKECDQSTLDQNVKAFLCNAHKYKQPLKQLPGPFKGYDLSTL